MKKPEFFVERRTGQDDYAIRKPNSERASDVAQTQREAIERARELNPNATIHVERQRHTNQGRPDQWRNP